MPVHAFIFPGQGSQAVGMGRDLAAAFAAAREVFEEVDDTLKQKLSKLMFEGPGRGADPDREHPARADGALARGAARAGEGGRLRRCARRRSWSPATRSANTPRWPPPAPSRSADAARLLKLRGQTMQKAVPAGEGAMAALLGAEMAQARGDLRRGRAGARQRPARARGHRTGQRQWRRPDRRSPATAARSSAPSRSPRPRACGGRCCCRSPPRSTAR